VRAAVLADKIHLDLVDVKAVVEQHKTGQAREARLHCNFSEQIYVNVLRENTLGNGSDIPDIHP
jgi:hypothetical protein